MKAESDLLALDALIPEEERLVVEAVRRFVDEEVLPHVAGWYESATFPRHLIRELGALGLLGATLDEHGGAGASELAYGLIMRELERGDAGLRSFASVQSGLVIYPIRAYGSEAQRARWLPRLVRGEAVGCFGLTEPDFGSNPGGMRTRARRDGDGWVLDGRKRWITNGGMADVAVVFARVDEGIQGFLVETDRPGFTVEEMTGKLSMRASVTSELIFEGVRLPADAALPGARGLKSALGCLNQARYGIAWGAMGSARFCFDTALRYTRERVQFDRPIAGFQLAQEKLAEMYGAIVQGELLCHRLAQLKQAGAITPAAISVGKRQNVAAARRVAALARELLGANGIMGEYGVMRHMANTETVYTYEGTHDMHTLIVGQALTGLAAFSG